MERATNRALPLTHVILYVAALFVAAADTLKPTGYGTRQNADPSAVLDRLPADWRRPVKAYLILDADDIQHLLLSRSKDDLEGNLLYLLSLQPNAEDFV